MNEEINGKSVHDLLQQSFTNSFEDAESAGYSGCSFMLYGRFIKLRKAKVTPKKEGVFTSLWKRNTIGKTVPFDENDPFDFYIIMAERNSKAGYFVFPARVLVENGILSGSHTDGKRGFRLYPSWTAPQNKQAKKRRNGNWNTSSKNQNRRSSESVF